jgi:hypothetical protein
MHVQAGQQRERAVPLVLVLDPEGPAGRGRQRRVGPFAGLDRRLGVEGQDPVAFTGGLSLVEPLVEVQDHGRFRLEVRVAGEDPRLVPPRAHRVLREDPQHRRC